MKVRNLVPLTMLVALLVAANALSAPLIYLLELPEPGDFEMPWETPALAAAMSLAVLTRIVFAVWIYMAGANLLAAGRSDLEYTPAARIWWFVVPILCFWKPYLGMRELWEASHGNVHETGPATLDIWWALWLAVAACGVVIAFSENRTALFLFHALNIALAVAAVAVIRAIARAQRTLSAEDLSELFA